jgi:hypothetical protein
MGRNQRHITGIFEVELEGSATQLVGLRVQTD